MIKLMYFPFLSRSFSKAMPGVWKGHHLLLLYWTHLTPLPQRRKSTISLPLWGEGQGEREK